MTVIELSITLILIEGVKSEPNLSEKQSSLTRRDGGWRRRPTVTSLSQSNIKPGNGIIYSPYCFSLSNGDKGI